MSNEPSPYPIRRLTKVDLPAVTEHLFSLSQPDRYARFGMAINDAGLLRYVRGLDMDRDRLFGSFSGETLVGLAHCAGSEDAWEVALSVLASHQGHGIAGALLQRIRAVAFSKGVSRLELVYSGSNIPIHRITQKMGAYLRLVAGPERIAVIEG